MSERTKSHRKKDLTITMKSQPLKGSQSDTTHVDSNNKARPRDYKKKGTRGSAWIG